MFYLDCFGWVCINNTSLIPLGPSHEEDLGPSVHCRGERSTDQKGCPGRDYPRKDKIGGEVRMRNNMNQREPCYN